MKNQAGFSLIEVLLAMVLIGIVAVAVPSALATANKTTIVNSKHSTAETLARSQMDYVQSQSYDKINNPPVYSVIPNVPAGYAIITPMAQRLDPKGDGTINDDGLQKITVTVTYQSKTEYTLVDYKLSTKP